MSLSVDVVGRSLVLNQFRALFSQSEEVEFAVAYLRKTSLELLRDEIEELLSKDERIRITIGTRRNTEASALAELLELEEEYSDLIEVRHIYNEKFHPKLYIFRQDDDVSAFVGSSNLTGGGLAKNIELNLLVSGDRSDPIIRKLTAFFENLWNGSELLTKDVVKKLLDYEAELEEKTKMEPDIPLPEISELPIDFFQPKEAEPTTPPPRFFDELKVTSMPALLDWFHGLLDEDDKKCQRNGFEQYREQGCYHVCPIKVNKEEEGCALGNAIWQDFCPGKLRELKENFEELDEKQFREILDKWTMMFPVRKPQFTTFFEENPTRLKKVIDHIWNEEIDIEQRYDDVLFSKEYKIKGTGPLTMTHLFSSVNKEKYLVLHNYVLLSLNRLGFDFIPARVSSVRGKHYKLINEICRELMRVFRETYGLGLPLAHFFLWAFGTLEEVDD